MPISFFCPHCGSRTEVADMYAGQTGPCASCGKTITVPGPGGAVAPKKSSAMMIVLIVAAVFAVMFVVCGILVALLLPAVNAAREAARNAACMNNIKQINLALMNYESKNGKFPPAYTTDPSGKPLHSWRVLILPYLDRDDVYRQIRLNEPWNSPHNAAVAAAMPDVFRCPSESKSPIGSETSYLMLTGPGTVFEGGKSPGMMDFRAGRSNTPIIVEASGQKVNWMEPRDLDVRQLDTLRSPHASGVNVGFADGSVRRHEAKKAAEELKSLLRQR